MVLFFSYRSNIYQRVNLCMGLFIGSFTIGTAPTGFLPVFVYGYTTGPSYRTSSLAFFGKYFTTVA